MDDPLGVWVITGTDLLAMLNLVAEGADPDLLMAEEYANRKVDPPPPA